ncbi:MAG: rRNA methyltransferase [Bacteroidota bacterium]
MYPEAFLARMQTQLGDQYSSFLAALADEPAISLRLNPHKYPQELSLEPVPWTKQAYYLPERPTFTLDPLWHAGAYYVQEASSMLLEQALRQHLDLNTELRALDLCAAPGGKSTHIQSLLSPSSLLVANEVIKSRSRILRENIIRWGAANVLVSNNDPADFKSLQGFFDLIVVDAPCSGEGLFRKDPAAVNEWSPSNLQICVERQQRILAEIWPSLKAGGILVYSTCTYHPAENEANLAWLARRSDFEVLELVLDDAWGFQQLESNGIIGYQALPHRVKGEGFFLSVLRKKGSEESTEGLSVRKAKLEKLSRKERTEIGPWLSQAEVAWGKVGEKVFAFPESQTEVWEGLYERLQVISGGLLVAERKKKGYVPSHNLAMSQWLNEEAFPAGVLDWDKAINYLRREAIRTDAPNGWALVKYADLPLGWIKQVGHRANNYYPQEWRIRMNKPAEKTWTLA